MRVDSDSQERRRQQGVLFVQNAHDAAAAGGAIGMLLPHLPLTTIDVVNNTHVRNHFFNLSKWSKLISIFNCTWRHNPRRADCRSTSAPAHPAVAPTYGVRASLRGGSKKW